MATTVCIKDSIKSWLAGRSADASLLYSGCAIDAAVVLLLMLILLLDAGGDAAGCWWV
jgi:hypothetical protein